MYNNGRTEKLICLLKERYLFAKERNLCGYQIFYDGRKFEYNVSAEVDSKNEMVTVTFKSHVLGCSNTISYHRRFCYYGDFSIGEAIELNEKEIIEYICKRRRDLEEIPLHTHRIIEHRLSISDVYVVVDVYFKHLFEKVFENEYLDKNHIMVLRSEYEKVKSELVNNKNSH